MSLSQELDKLDQLHRQGTLSDAEFTRAKARVLGDAAATPPDTGGARINAWRRSRDKRWLGGVCGGLGELTGVEAWIWRVLFVLASTCAGTGIAVYMLLWIFVPQEPGPVHPANA
jgi:phage shock protein C